MLVFFGNLGTEDISQKWEKSSVPKFPKNLRPQMKQK